LFNNSLIFWLKAERSIPVIGKKLVVRPGVFIGGTYQRDLPASSDLPISYFQRPPVQHWFYLGGQAKTNYLKSIQPFTGIDFLQRYGLYQYTIDVEIQYNFYQKLYATLMGDIGGTSWFIADLFTKEKFILGYGLKASYDSFIGPVSVSVMGSNIYPGVSFFVGIGYWF